MRNIWFLTMLLLICEFQLTAQHGEVKISITDCVYNSKRGELEFTLMFHNNTRDTIHALRVNPTKLFDTSKMPRKMYGLTKRPFRIVANNLSRCITELGVESEEKNIRYVLPSEQFTDIFPGEEKHLGGVTISKSELCFTPIPTAPFSLQLEYEISVSQDYFSLNETEELQSISAEFESMQGEMKSFRPRIFFNFNGVDSYIEHYANYQKLLNRLYTGKLVSEPAMVQIK
jgi:hypothetical protein